jgi:hypothetical protein
LSTKPDLVSGRDVTLSSLLPRPEALEHGKLIPDLLDNRRSPASRTRVPEERNRPSQDTNSRSKEI